MRCRKVFSLTYALFPSFRTSLPTYRLLTSTRRARRHTLHVKCVSKSTALAVFKLYMAQMMGSTPMQLRQALTCARLPRPPQLTPRTPISRLSRLLLVKMTPPPVMGVRRVATPCCPLTAGPHRPLVMRKSNPWHRPAADSLHQLPSLHHGGAKRTETSSGVRGVVGTAKHRQS
jgi:hypothetical protein